MPRTRRRPPNIVTSDEGDVWVLATTEADALAEAKAVYEDDDMAVSVVFESWMHNDGWDRDNYDTKREFLEDSGYQTWWTPVHGSVDAHEETAKLRRGWAVQMTEIEEIKEAEDA